MSTEPNESNAPSENGLEDISNPGNLSSILDDSVVSDSARNENPDISANPYPDADNDPTSPGAGNPPQSADTTMESFVGLSDNSLQNALIGVENYDPEHPTIGYPDISTRPPPTITPTVPLVGEDISNIPGVIQVPDPAIVSLDELNCASIAIGAGNNSMGGQPPQNVPQNGSQPNQSPRPGQQMGNLSGQMNQSYSNQPANGGSPYRGQSPGFNNGANVGGSPRSVSPAQSPCSAANNMSPGQGIFNISNPMNYTGNTSMNSTGGYPSPGAGYSPGVNGFAALPFNTSRAQSINGRSPYRRQSQGFAFDANASGGQMQSPRNVSPYSQPCPANNMSPRQGQFNNSNLMNFSTSMNDSNSGRSGPGNSPGANRIAFAVTPLNTPGAQPVNTGSPYRGQSPGGNFSGRQMQSPRNVSPNPQPYPANNMSPRQGQFNNSNLMNFSTSMNDSSPGASLNGRQMPSPRNASAPQPTCSANSGAGNMSIGDQPPNVSQNNGLGGPYWYEQPQNYDPYVLRQLGPTQPYGPKNEQETFDPSFPKSKNFSPFDSHEIPKLTSPPPSPYWSPSSSANSSRRSRSNGGANVSVPGAADDMVIDVLINEPGFQATLRQTIQTQVKESINRLWDMQLDELVPIVLSKFLNLELPKEIERRILNGTIPEPIPCDCFANIRSTESGFLQDVSMRMDYSLTQ